MLLASDPGGQWSDKDPVKGIISSSLIMLLPLALIWFAESMGSARGRIGHWEVDADSPGWFVAGFGWLVLVASFVYLGCRLLTR